MIYLYTVIVAIASAVIGIFIALRKKKAANVTYGKLDRIGQITNIFLLIGYLYFSPLYLFLGMISNPSYDGFLGILGWIVSFIIASASAFCCIGLGLSVAFRKQGRSKLSFAVQFTGVFGIGLTVLLYYIFTGNLLDYLN